MGTVQRRHFLLAAGALLGAPRLGHSQSRVWRVAYITSGALSEYDQEFPKGMRDLGYEVGKNLVIEWRSANGQYDLLPGLIADVLRKNVDLIIAAGTPVAQAAKQATSKVAVVMTTVGDPVASGIVASLARPGGNITGLSLANADLPGKWLELGTTVTPQGHVLVLADRNQPTAPAYVKSIQGLAQRRRVSVSVAYAFTAKEIEDAFASAPRNGAATTAIILPSGLLQTIAAQIADLAVRYRVRSIATTRIYSERGVLLSYGQNYGAFTRQAATYVDKIFKGAKPGELPIEQPLNLELVVNLATAKKLGIELPNEVLARADTVIK